MMPAANSLITDSSAAAQNRIIAIEGGMMLSMNPVQVMMPTENFSL